LRTAAEQLDALLGCHTSIIFVPSQIHQRRTPRKGTPAQTPLPRSARRADTPGLVDELFAAEPDPLIGART
jgi:hypothetical protein